jgi:hypothetical protein
VFFSHTEFSTFYHHQLFTNLFVPHYHHHQQTLTTGLQAPVHMLPDYYNIDDVSPSEDWGYGLWGCEKCKKKLEN